MRQMRTKRYLSKLKGNDTVLDLPEMNFRFLGERGE